MSDFTPITIPMTIDDAEAIDASCGAALTVASRNHRNQESLQDTPDAIPSSPLFDLANELVLQLAARGLLVVRMSA